MINLKRFFIPFPFFENLLILDHCLNFLFLFHLSSLEPFRTKRSESGNTTALRVFCIGQSGAPIENRASKFLVLAAGLFYEKVTVFLTLLAEENI